MTWDDGIELSGWFAIMAVWAAVFVIGWTKAHREEAPGSQRIVLLLALDAAALVTIAGLWFPESNRWSFVLALMVALGGLLWLGLVGPFGLPRVRWPRPRLYRTYAAQARRGNVRTYRRVA